MRKSMLVVLLVATVLVVADAKDGWFRKVVDKVKDTLKKVIDKVKDFVNEHFPGIGKRSADPCSAENELAMAELMQELENACPTFGIDSQSGLNAKAVDYAFETSDEDGDGALNSKELGVFENIIDVYQECVNIAKRK